MGKHFNPKLVKSLISIQPGPILELDFIPRVTADPADKINTQEDCSGQPEDQGNRRGSVDPLLEGTNNGHDLFGLGWLWVHEFRVLFQRSLYQPDSNRPCPAWLGSFLSER